MKPFFIVAAVILAVLAVRALQNDETLAAFGNLIVFDVFLFGFAAIVGYLVWLVKLFGKMTVEVGKAIPKIASVGSPKRFTEQMRRYSEGFSFEYFTNKVVSLLQAVIYSSEDAQIPFYRGPETTRFDHVVEASFDAAVGVRSFKVEGGICTVEASAFMENFYHEGGKMAKRNEKVFVTLQKDLSEDIDYHFNAQAIRCEACGASYDALMQRSCLYCGHETDLCRHDWVITDIQ